MKPNIGIPDDHLTEISRLLNILLADEFNLYVKTRSCHWNVTGPAFSILHKFFEDQYQQIEGMIDEVAERVRMLGQMAVGNMSTIQNTTRLSETKDESGAMKMVQGLLNDHEIVIRGLRDDINTVTETYKDAGTADFMTGILATHEKMAWMLRAHL